MIPFDPSRPLSLEKSIAQEPRIKKEEEKDPRVKKQQEALKKGATKTTTKKYNKNKQPDLPVEQTMKYLKATPAEHKKMKAAEKKKPIIGTASIEEKKDNEN